MYICIISIYNISIFYLGTFNTSNIDLIGTKEIETPSQYKFELEPESNLPNNFVIYIRLPALMSIENCNTTHGNCDIDINTNYLILTNILGEELSYNCCSPFEFNVTGIINPSKTVDLNSIIIQVETKDNERTMHKKSITLSGIDVHYIPHNFITQEISISNSSTVAKAEYLFNFTLNSTHKVPSGSILNITFPSSTLQVIDLEGTQGSYFTFLQGNTSDPGDIRIYNLSTITVAGGFGDGDDNSGGVIRFRISNIVNPYEQGVMNYFNVIIYDEGSEHIYKSFVSVNNNSMTLDINDTSRFESLTITPQSSITSQLVYYTFEIKLGYGELKVNEVVANIFPEQIIYCNESTLKALTGFSSCPITNETFNRYNANIFRFKVPCHIPQFTTFSYEIECQNPETLKGTEEFLVLARRESGNTDTYRFYKDNAHTITMTELNNFTSATFTMEHQLVGTQNNYNLTVTKTSNKTSTDINKIVIELSHNLHIRGCAVQIISGITNISSNIEFNCSGRTITIANFTSVSHTFSIQINNIVNPNKVDDDIYFNILTTNTENLGSEQSDTEIKYLSCNYPCKYCSPADPDYCTDCFPKDDPIWDDAIPPKYWRINNKCIKRCPYGQYYDQEIKNCSGNNIYIYIYI